MNQREVIDCSRLEQQTMYQNVSKRDKSKSKNIRNRFQDSRTPQKMENPGASLPELLVATNVQVHTQVHFHM